MRNDHERNIKTDIVLELGKQEGKPTLDTTGLVDNRLFTGHNKLHAIMDKQTCLWHFKYDQGILPRPLQQQFTSFNRLKTFAETYFNNRNIDIVKVVD